MKVNSLYRFPVKGLNGQSLDHIDLTPGREVLGDRRFAIRHGETDFDPAHPEHLSKTKFLALMTHAEMAELTATFERDNASFLRLHDKAGLVFEGDLLNAKDASRLETAIGKRLGERCKGAPKLVHAEGHMFSDVPEKCLSVVNLASVQALSDTVGVPLDPLRFRANIYIDGLPAWAERDWPEGMRLKAGNAALKAFKPIMRCNAVNVNLDTAAVDQNLPQVLMKEHAANLMGVYFFVEQGGKLSVGDGLAVP